MANTTYTLGRVGMNLRGEYSSTTAYAPLDVVSYQGSSYAAKVNTTGTSPADTSKWMCLAQGAPDYFTSEQPTGQNWIDGKAVYRRIVTGNIAAKATNTTLATLSNVGTVIQLRGVYVNSSGTTWAIPMYYSTTAYIRLSVDANGNVVGYSNNSTGSMIVEVLYTKAS